MWQQPQWIECNILDCTVQCNCRETNTTPCTSLPSLFDIADVLNSTFAIPKARCKRSKWAHWDCNPSNLGHKEALLMMLEHPMTSYTWGIILNAAPLLGAWKSKQDGGQISWFSPLFCTFPLLSHFLLFSPIHAVGEKVVEVSGRMVVVGIPHQFATSDNHLSHPTDGLALSREPVYALESFIGMKGPCNSCKKMKLCMLFPARTSNKPVTEWLLSPLIINLFFKIT